MYKLTHMFLFSVVSKRDEWWFERTRNQKKQDGSGQYCNIVHNLNLHLRVSHFFDNENLSSRDN